MNTPDVAGPGSSESTHFTATFTGEIPADLTNDLWEGLRMYHEDVCAIGATGVTTAISFEATNAAAGQPPDELANQRAESAARYGLTAREFQVLELIRLGLENSEVAASLGITTQTVKTHLKRIAGRVGSGKRVVMLGIVYGLTAPEELS